MNLTDQALADRDASCDMPRIPTGKYPVFSTTLRGTFDANGNAQLEFSAERDVLFIGMSVSLSSGTALVSAEYCNTKYLVRSISRIWAKCCDRKPVFLVGVRDNKRLVFNLSGGSPDGSIKITLHGFQGNGCCS